jgi:beta-glucosidase/6-phospho-beta-glucosidase/beta-galactosidase
MTATESFLPHLAGRTDFHPDSRVWVYVASRKLKNDEQAALQDALQVFVQKWTAHNQALKAVAEVFENQIIVLMVDETQAGASGCSIDKSVHFLEQAGRELNVDLFDRMRFGAVIDGTLQLLSKSDFAAAVADGRITSETPVVNTLVQSRRDMLEKWLLPFGQSWHRRVV